MTYKKSMTKNGSNVLQSKFQMRELNNAVPGDEREIDEGGAIRLDTA